jgi:hypothetical protein
MLNGDSRVSKLSISKDLMKQKKYHLVAMIAALAMVLIAATPSAADSIVDESGTSWTVVRDFNKNSNGWDLRLIVSGNDDRVIWVTQDSIIDRDPAIALDPLSGKPVVFWSRQIGTEYRIFSSALHRGSFSEPSAVTAGGQGFSDSQPFVQYDEYGQCHLVWFRQRADGMGAAFYASRTGVSWTTAEQISVSLDNVIGTVTIDVPSDEHDFLRATYQYYRPDTGTTETREVCRGGDTSPWSACH